MKVLAWLSLLLLALPTQASADVLCKTKKGNVKVRAACKPKESLLDLSALGARGAGGPAGANGDAGPAGATGPTGVAGMTGVTGPRGSSGRRWRYWSNRRSRPSRPGGRRGGCCRRSCRGGGHRPYREREHPARPCSDQRRAGATTRRGRRLRGEPDRAVPDSLLREQRLHRDSHSFPPARQL